MRHISRLNPAINSAETADQRRDAFRVTAARRKASQHLTSRLRSMLPRTRHLATTIHTLGPRPLHELFCDLIVASPATLPLLERYAALAPYADLIAAYGGRELSSNIWRIK